MLRRLFSLIFSRYLFITLGLIALGLAIWYLGPLFAFANYRPLEPVKVRVWIIIGILVLLNVGPFSFISLAYYLCLWTPDELERAVARIRRGRACSGEAHAGVRDKRIVLGRDQG